MRISDWISDVCSSGLARAPQEEPLDIPPNEMERIVHQMLTREYTKTLDEAVPALGHKTPRALARTKAGRPKVADWLQYIENGAAKSGPGAPMATYDFTWMWDKLGLIDLRRSPPSYPLSGIVLRSETRPDGQQCGKSV